jgi:hypothetical protein
MRTEQCCLRLLWKREELDLFLETLIGKKKWRHPRSNEPDGKRADFAWRLKAPAG